jgi:hypothetical protein
MVKSASQLFHDLVNQLTVAKVSVELLQRGGLNGKTLDNAHEALEQMADMIAELRFVVLPNEVV